MDGPIPVVNEPDAGAPIEVGGIPVVNKSNPHVSIKFEEKDLSIGTARYKGAKRINKNLAIKPSGAPGLPGDPMPHANVEVHLFDDQDHEVPMTGRLVRYWTIQPEPGATVENLSDWRIVGLEHSEFSPFSPFPVSAKERPDQTEFQWDRPGTEDAPGFQDLSGKANSSQLQEFLVGNEKAGGAYYQIYTLKDGSKYKVTHSKAMTLSASEYRDVLKFIKSGNYAKTMSHKLFFMPAIEPSDSTPYRTQHPTLKAAPLR